MMYAAVFTGSSYAPNHDESTIEVHASLEDAYDSLIIRYLAGGRSTVDFTTLDGVYHEVYMPCVEPGDTLTLYRLNDDTYPDAVATEGQVMEALTAIHGGAHDLVLRLIEHEDGNENVAVVITR